VQFLKIKHTYFKLPDPQNHAFFSNQIKIAKKLDLAALLLVWALR